MGLWASLARATGLDGLADGEAVPCGCGLTLHSFHSQVVDAASLSHPSRMLTMPTYLEGRGGTSALPFQQGSRRLADGDRRLPAQLPSARLPSTTWCIGNGGKMAGVLVPGVAQAVWGGTVSGHPFNQIWHFQNPSPGTNWTQGQLQTLGNALASGMNTQLAKFLGNNAEYNSLTLTDIGTPTPQVADAAGLPFSGSQVGNDVSPNLSVMVLFHIAARYRGGHPRTYFPPSTASNLTTTEDQWTGGLTSEFATGMANVIDAAVAALPGVTHVVPRYTYTYTDNPSKHKYTHTRSGVISPVPIVSSYSTSAIVRSQRRRLTSGG